MSEYVPIDNIDEEPIFVFKTANWLELADLKFIPLRDKNTGSYAFLLKWKEIPDYHLEIDKDGKNFLIFSNVVTNLNDQSLEKVVEFWMRVSSPSLQYSPVKMVYDPETGNVRAHLHLFWFELNAELFIRIVKSVAKLMEDVANIVDDLELPDIWRKTEGEEKNEEKATSNE